MAMKELTVADVLKDVIDAKAFETPTEKPAASPVKKAFRVLTGDYQAELKQIWRREDAKGRRHVSILARLENKEGKFRGSTFVKASWQLVTRADGSPDRQFSLFQQLVQVLGAPASAKIDQVLGAIEGERVKVRVTEYFDVPVNAALDSEYARNAGYATTRVYITDQNEHLVAGFQQAGYESKGDVQRISSLN